MASAAGTTGEKEPQRRKMANARRYLKDMLSVSEKPLREALGTGAWNSSAGGSAREIP